MDIHLETNLMDYIKGIQPYLNIYDICLKLVGSKFLQ
jgi:hypothetical protein